MVKFLKKKLILAEASAHLKNTPICANEDFPQLLRMKTAGLIPGRKLSRDKGNYVVINYNRLVVKAQKHWRMTETRYHGWI